MDSKIKRLTILGMISMILLVGVVVVFMNSDKIMTKTKTTAVTARSSTLVIPIMKRASKSWQKFWSNTLKTIRSGISSRPLPDSKKLKAAPSTAKVIRIASTANPASKMPGGIATGNRWSNWKIRSKKRWTSSCSRQLTAVNSPINKNHRKGLLQNS